jgi:hypothetical protein
MNTNMNTGRLYSRRQGWLGSEEKEKCVKFFHSGILSNLPPIDLQDRDGKYISNYLSKNKLENEYNELYANSKWYENWYFYYGDDITIFSAESL